MFGRIPKNLITAFFEVIKRKTGRSAYSTDTNVATPQPTYPRPTQARETARKTNAKQYPYVEKIIEQIENGKRRIKSTIYNEPMAPGNSWKNFATYIIEQRKAGAPRPELQGMWQAYGQIRAAKTTGRYAVLATGVAGIGLWGYQQMLSRQKVAIEAERDAVKEKEALLGEQKTLIADQKAEYERSVKMAAVFERKLAVSHESALQTCHGEQKCINEYLKRLKAAEEQALKEVREKVGKIKP